MDRDIVSLINSVLSNENINIDLLFYKFIEIWIYYNKLEDYVSIKNSGFYYNKNDLSIAKYYESLSKKDLGYIQFNMSYFKIKENKIMTVLDFLKHILHELEHSYQTKLKREFSISDTRYSECFRLKIMLLLGASQEFYLSSKFSDSRKLKEEYKKSLQKFIKIYHQYHDFSPAERLANIEALRKLKKIIIMCNESGLLFEQNFNKIIRENELEENERLLQGYSTEKLYIPFKKIQGPSLYYFQKQYEIIPEDLFYLLKNNNLSEQERLYLGLPVFSKTIRKNIL